jgi:hypothetical protein
MARFGNTLIAMNKELRFPIDRLVRVRNKEIVINFLIMDERARIGPCLKLQGATFASNSFFKDAPSRFTRSRHRFKSDNDASRAAQPRDRI